MGKSKSDRKRSMWICPKCRRSFKNRNQAHSCGKYTVSTLLEGKPDGVVAPYRRLEQTIVRCGEVVIAPTKTRVLFKVRTVFAAVGLTRSALNVFIVLGRRVQDPRIKKVQVEYPGIVHVLRIGSPDELDDELEEWFQEAYVYRCEKDTAP